MFFIAVLVAQLLQLATATDSRFQILGSGGDAAGLTHLAVVATEAVSAYEATFEPLKSAIRIQIGATDCLRVGYSFEKDAVVFCSTGDVVNSGLNSDDVIRHELFHAMLCRNHGEFCAPGALKSIETTSLHEGLADAFAYSLKPGRYFGEGFYATRAYVRQYQTSLCYALTDGAHGKGNALVSRLIRQAYNINDLHRFILAGNFSVPALVALRPEPADSCLAAIDPPAIAAHSLNYPESALNRFYIAPDKPLILDFVSDKAFNARFNDLKIVWTTDRGASSVKFSVAADKAAPPGIQRFEITPLLNKGFEKILANYYSDGHLIGLTAFYFVKR